MIENTRKDYQLAIPLATSFEEAVILFNLGLTEKTADFLYVGNCVAMCGDLVPKDELEKYRATHKIDPDETDIIPAWSLSALFNLIPEGINVFDSDVENIEKIYEKDSVFYELSFDKHSMQYTCEGHEPYMKVYGMNLLETVVDALTHFLTHGWTEDDLIDASTV